MMRKSYFFTQRLFAAILLFMGCVSASYADDITINPSTASRGNFVCCFNGSYEDRYSTSQSIYTAEEMGGHAGNITAISYLVFQKGATFRPNMKIYMGLVSKGKTRFPLEDQTASNYTALSDSVIKSTELTLVYSGSPLLGAAAQNEWDELTLDNSFYYNGSDNLAVVVCTSDISDIDEDDLGPAYWTYTVPVSQGRNIGRAACPSENTKYNYTSYGDINVTSFYQVHEYVPCIKFTIGEAAGNSEVTIGTGSSINALAPYETGAKNSITQTVYTMSELGNAGNITDISYEVGKQSTMKLDELQIYMGHKGSTFSSKTDAMKVADLQLVYSGTDVVIGNTSGWEKITLQKPFSYNGSQNLVVVVCKKASTTNSELQYKYTAMSSGAYGLYREGSASAVADINSTGYAYTMYSQRPNIKFTKAAASSDDDTDISTLANAIYTSNMSAYPGAQVVLPISLKNSITDVTAVQFDVTLPDGLTVAEDEEGAYKVSIYGKRTSSTLHNTVAGRYISDNVFRVVCSSTSLATFSGDDGNILSLTLNVSKDVAATNCKISYSGVFVSDTNGTSYTLPNFNYTLDVNETIKGDTNTDGLVNISDYVRTINYIIGTLKTTDSDVFDVNGDGQINIADPVSIIKIVQE